MVKKDIRISDELNDKIKQLLPLTSHKKEAELLRELLEIGYNLKLHEVNNRDDEQENWENVYKDTAIKLQECHYLIKKIFNFTYNQAKSTSNSLSQATKDNLQNTHDRIDFLLNSSKYDVAKFRGEKSI